MAKKFSPTRVDLSDEGDNLNLVEEDMLVFIPENSRVHRLNNYPSRHYGDMGDQDLAPWDCYDD